MCIGDRWRFGSGSNGVPDPYGSQAFYGAIAKVVLGRRYDRKGTVCVTLEQCGFFYHVVSQIILNLASSNFLILNDVITSN